MFEILHNNKNVLQEQNKIAKGENEKLRVILLIV